jgi:hypothetical protein
MPTDLQASTEPTKPETFVDHAPLSIVGASAVIISAVVTLLCHTPAITQVVDFGVTTGVFALKASAAPVVDEHVVATLLCVVGGLSFAALLLLGGAQPPPESRHSPGGVNVRKPTDEEWAHEHMLVRRAFVAITVLNAAFFWLYTASDVPSDEAEALSAYIASRQTTNRPALLSSASALVMLAVMKELFFSASCPPAVKGDSKWHSTLVFGHGTYLTTQLLALQAFHSVASAAAEVLLLMVAADGPPLISLWAATLVHAALPRLLRFTYAASVFASGCGLCLTLLFTLLCWCDAEWQEVVRHTRERQGYPGYGIAMLWQHVPSAFVALAELSAGLKDRSLQHALKQGLASVNAISAVYCTFYVSLVLLNYRLTRAWPYPILEHIHGPIQWLGFLLSVAAFVCTCVTTLFFIAP